MTGEPICPQCNRRVGDRTFPGELLCTPLSCDAWNVVATFEHDSRTWVPASAEVVS